LVLEDVILVMDMEADQKMVGAVHVEGVENVLLAVVLADILE